MHIYPNTPAKIMNTNSNIQIITTRPGEDNFQYFLDTPSNIHPYYRFQVEEKNQVNEEFLYTCIVVLKGQIPVGRVAIYKNPALYFEGKPCIGIGNYECINDHEISQALLNTACEHIKTLGNFYIIGPFNGSIWDDYRFSEYHKNLGFFREPFHPVYYNQQFIDFGFQPISRYASRINHNLNYLGGTSEPDSRWTEKGISFRTFDMEHFEEELDKMYPFCMEAFSENFLSTPISKAGFLNIYLPAAGCIDGKYVILAENQSGELVGMIFGVLDFLNTDEKRLIIRTLGRKKDHYLKGLGGELARQLYAKAREDDFDAIIHAFMDFGQDQRQDGPTMIGEPYQSYVLYGRSID